MLGFVVVAMLQVAAASPAPDLSTYLAPAPSPDWVDAPAAPDVINGPFTAHDWAAYVGDTRTEGTLNRTGFVAGYGKSWEQKVTQDFLEEQVFEFKSSDGARRAYDGFKLAGQTSKHYSSEFAAWDSKVSWGSKYVFDDGDQLFSVQFRKGPLFFMVNLYSTDRDLTGTAVQIARGEDDAAPLLTELANSTSPLPQAAQWAIGLGLIVFVVLVGTVIFVIVRQRRTEIPLVAAGLQMSADRAYWWDGAQWRAAATDIPPTAQRSADGVYWWDGQTWRQAGH